MSAQSTRLPGLDGIRGLAAVGVLLTHIEQSRLVFSLPSFYMAFAERRIGQLSVTLFFVLSGFLITTLLLQEKRNFGTIDTLSFYMRRALRIWPLYYLITVISFFIIPHIDLLALPGTSPSISSFWAKLSLYVALSPHVAQSLYPDSPVLYGAVLWSVGVEEWFYLFWPWILLLPRRALFIAIPVLLVGPSVCRLVFTTGAQFYFFSQVRFDCMALGATGALCMFYRDRPIFGLVMKAIIDGFVWYLSILALFVLVFFGVRFGVADDVVYGLLFTFVIVNAAASGRGKAWLETAPMRFLGAVSYGAYCFNWIAAVLALRIVQATGLNTTLTGHAIHLVLGVGLTLAFAALSRQFFEKPFLRLKERSFTPGRSNEARLPVSGIAS